MTEHVDTVVIGAGPGGELAANRLLEAGRTVALVERELIGGECGYWACIPSKTLLRSAEVVQDTASTPGAGPEGGVDLDRRAALAWRDEMRRQLDDSAQVADYERRGALVLKGTARLDGPGRVDVDGRVLTTDHVVLATGSVPVVPDVDGLDDVTVWTNREATGFDAVPERVAVIGGSAVAVEVSQYLRAFDSRVTVVGRAPRLLAREEPRVGELVEHYLRGRGIKLRLGRTATGAARDGDGATLRLDDGSTLGTDVVVLGTGRRPRTEGLGLDTVPGLTVTSEGAVAVDETCRAADGVWAIGDVTAISPFTHVAKHQARVATDTILGRRRTARYDAVPRVVFGIPEVAAVGRTREQAAADGVRVRTAEVDLAATLARPLTYGTDPSAALGVVADADRGTLVGAWAVGPHAGEWIHLPTLAVAEQVPVERLLDHVAQFPTFSEGWVAAVEALDL